VNEKRLQVIMGGDLPSGRRTFVRSKQLRTCSGSWTSFWIRKKRKLIRIDLFSACNCARLLTCRNVDLSYWTDLTDV